MSAKMLHASWKSYHNRISEAKPLGGVGSSPSFGKYFNDEVAAVCCIANCGSRCHIGVTQ